MTSPIPRTFFLTGLGRSGTAFLAAALARSPSYRVVHEWKIPRTPFRDGRLTHFPLWRFYLARHPFEGRRRGYGEVNSHLRRTLSATTAGREALVERRGVILRDPRAVIASGMNRSGRTDADFEGLCASILRDFALLQGLLVHPTLHYERFEFRRFTADPAEVERVARWAGITDLDVPDELVSRKVNTNTTDTFPSWPSWQREHVYVFERMADQLAIRAQIDELSP